MQVFALPWTHNRWSVKAGCYSAMAESLCRPWRHPFTRHTHMQVATMAQSHLDTHIIDSIEQHRKLTPNTISRSFPSGSCWLLDFLDDDVDDRNPILVGTVTHKHVKLHNDSLTPTVIIVCWFGWRWMICVNRWWSWISWTLAITEEEDEEEEEERSFFISNNSIGLAMTCPRISIYGILFAGSEYVHAERTSRGSWVSVHAQQVGENGLFYRLLFTRTKYIANKNANRLGD